MHRPIAGQFHGSQPTEDVGELSSLADKLNLAFAILALLGAAAVWVGAYAMADDPNLFEVLKGSCLLLLLPSLIGLWIVRQAERAPGEALAGIYRAVFRRLAQGEKVAVPSTDPQGGYRGLAGLLANLAMTTRKLRLRHGEDRERLAVANLALACGRAQAGQLADQIRMDTACLTRTAARIEAAGAGLSDQIAAATSAFDASDAAIGRALDGATNLASAVRATTAGAERMTALAVGLAQVAHETQRTIADLDDRSTSLSVMLDQVASVLGRAACDAQAPGTPDAEARAATLLGASEQILATLQDGMLILRELLSATGEANRRTAEISELVRSNHEVGHAIGHAVQQQAEDIAGILLQLYEARAGFVTLRAGVDAVARTGPLQAGTVDTLRETAQRLPNRAETIATILRNIPDFAPPPEY